MSERILVTGAAGFIAFHLVEALLRRGVHVVGLDNFDPFYETALKQANILDLKAIARETGAVFELKKMDVRALSAAHFPDQNFSAVIHLAAKAGVRPSLIAPEEYMQVNIQGTLQVLEFCRERGISRLIFGSSSSVYGDNTPVPFRETVAADHPVSPYAASKRAAELYCATYAHLYGISVAALRFFTVYGPRQRPDLAIHKFSRQIASGTPITLFGGGTTSRDYTFVADIIQGVLSALDWSARIPSGTYELFNLGGSLTTTLHGLVTMIEQSLGMIAQLRQEPLQPGDVLRTWADISKAATILGYSPKTAIEDGIPAFAQWFKSVHPEWFPSSVRPAA